MPELLTYLWVSTKSSLWSPVEQTGLKLIRKRWHSTSNMRSVYVFTRMCANLGDKSLWKAGNSERNHKNHCFPFLSRCSFQGLLTCIPKECLQSLLLKFFKFSWESLEFEKFCHFCFKLFGGARDNYTVYYAQLRGYLKVSCNSPSFAFHMSSRKDKCGVFGNHKERSNKMVHYSVRLL